MIILAIASVAKLHAQRDPRYGRALKSALQLNHIICGKAWEDTAGVFRQIETIGPKSIGKLNQEGVHCECLASEKIGKVIDGNRLR
jgi:hypothetical protein